jgi:hypothetical protein
MKETYLSRNLLETMVYRYSDLENPIENLADYEHIKDETEDYVYYHEDEEDNSSCYLLENIKSAYKQAEDVFNEINTLFHETANEVECYLYSVFGEKAKTFDIYNHYIKGKENYAKLKTFWLVLDNMNN